MSTKSGTRTPSDAAEAFYGQNETAFADQIRLMGASDPRLVDAFKRTRERYIQQKNDRSH